MTETRFGVYQIVNTANGKKYIGSTSRRGFYTRWNDHVKMLLNGKHNPIFQNSWNKWGQESFQFYVIQYFEKGDPRILKLEQALLDSIPRELLLNGTLQATGGNGGANKGMKHGPRKDRAPYAENAKLPQHINNQKSECPHCNKIGQRRNMIRWHFENCKGKLNG